jgi:glycerophosphoryl diester phosphodiesterase
MISRSCGYPFASLVVPSFLIVVTQAGFFDLQGHRGVRGHLPENSLPGFARAIEIGVTTIETDLAVTRDGILVTSHDTALNPDIARGLDGRWIGRPTPLISSLTFAELTTFDVGRIDPASSYARRFPRQKAVDGTHIPALSELFDLVNAAGGTTRLNLEIKTSPSRPSDTPRPDHVAMLVVDAVRKAGMEERTTIQSFDWRALVAVHALAPGIARSCLTTDAAGASTVRGTAGRPSPWLAGFDPASHGNSLPRLVAAAGCGTWSPDWRDLDAVAVEEAHALGLLVVPWTVNEDSDIRRMLAMGVDGLITDYPDVACGILRNFVP